MSPSIKKVACIGGGVIGAGWAARFALAGVDVVVYDTDTAAATAAVRRSLAAARRAWRRLTLSPPPAEGAVQTVDSLAAAVEGADFVQESLPEREELKQTILAEVDALLPQNVIIASSTSGLLPSRLQAKMQHPQRFCVAHPFNPVYLLPLVELCGGEQTEAKTVDAAAAFYKTLGMHPLCVRAEIDGFVADRMMEALWREALWLVHDGVASVSEVDDAIRYGCGLRWAFMGPFMTYRLGGGAGGMRHFMAQFAPSLKLPWTKLMDTPELDDALLEKIVSESDAQAAGQEIDELMQKRDDCLVAVLQGLRANDYAAGTLLRDFEMQRYAQVHGAAADGKRDAHIAAPLQLHTTTVAAEWIDYNGHMTESRYLQVFGDLSDALLHFIGLDLQAVSTQGSYYTVETHLRHLAEAKAGEVLVGTTQLLGADEKRMHLLHQLYKEESKETAAEPVAIATAEQKLLFVRGGRVCAAPPPVVAHLQAIAVAHQALPPPTLTMSLGKR